MIIVHEMLHFMFFDYVEKKYGKEFGWKKAESYGYLWKVSEAFNAVMEDWPPYKKLFLHASAPYPGTEKIEALMAKQWKRHHDIDKLLDYWLRKNQSRPKRI